MVQKLNLVTYFCYILAAMNVVALFTMPGSITTVLLSLFLAGLWYQTGTSFRKRKRWSWWIATILILLFSLGSLASVYITIITPFFDASIRGVGSGRWIALTLFIFSTYLLSIMLKASTRKEFKQ